MSTSGGPEFIIGGAPRSGTTWLYRQLDLQPDIYMAKPASPEPKFFLLPELYDKGLNYYRQHWFAAAPSGVVRGEKSTNYLENAEVAQRIAADLPAVKMIFVLRNPVDRAISNYFWSRQNEIETLPAERALDPAFAAQRPTPARWRYAQPFAYIRRGLYTQLLQPWLAAFPDAQLLVLEYEFMTQHPEQMLDRVVTFLGLEQTADRPLDRAPQNVSERKIRVPESVVENLRDYYTEPNQQLRMLLNRRFKHWN